MDKITTAFKEHYTATFAQHGATPYGVDWNREEDVLFRYSKLLDVLHNDREQPVGIPSLLDVGCGYGGLFDFCCSRGVPVDYTGIDLIPAMIDHARKQHTGIEFIADDIFNHTFERQFDYVVCGGIMTLRRGTIAEMEDFTNRLITQLFGLCQFGIAFDLMSTRVNFMSDNLYYRSPTETFQFCLDKVTPRVRIDHGYSSLSSGKGRLYQYNVYLYKDPPKIPNNQHPPLSRG